MRSLKNQNYRSQEITNQDNSLTYEHFNKLLGM